MPEDPSGRSTTMYAAREANSGNKVSKKIKGEDDGSALRRDEEQLDDRDSQPFRTIAFYSGKDGLIAQVRFLGGRK